MRSDNRSKSNFTTERVNETAQTVFYRIAQAWGLSHEEEARLLGISPHTDSEDSDKSLERISYIIGIYKNLRMIFPTEQQANAWVRRPNKNFNDRTALDVMIEDPASVRRHLDGQLN